MPPLFVYASTILQAFGFGAIAWKLVRRGLAKRYRVLLCFALFEGFRVSVAGLIPRGSDLYGYFYLVTQPLGWLLYASLTIEVFTLVFQAHRGIASLSRTVIGAAVIVAAAGASLSFALGQDESGPAGILNTFLALERAVMFSLLGFVLLLALFLSWYPVPLNRNSLAHAIIFTLFFGVNALGLLVITVVGTHWIVPVNYAVLAASLVSIVLWLGAISPEGETAVVRAGYSRDAFDQERLLAQMETINQSLMRSVRD
jgi:hypothetical protein